MDLGRAGFLALALGCGTLAACGGRAAGSGGLDAAVDGPGTHRDGAPGGPDGPADSPGPADAPLDGALESDGAVGDGASPLDGSSPGLIGCGAEVCDAGAQQCCVTVGGAWCAARGNCMGTLVGSCDGPDDCAPSEVCCGRYQNLSFFAACEPAGDCVAPGQRLCQLDLQCAAGERCCQGANVHGIAVRWCAALADCPTTNPTPGVPCVADAGSCLPPLVCCTTGGWACVAAGSCSGYAMACDGPEDCSGTTPDCCGNLLTGVTCVAAGTCPESLTGGVMCHSSLDCPPGRSCTPVPFSTYQVCR
jgi:hypothetical protein